MKGVTQYGKYNLATSLGVYKSFPLLEYLYYKIPLLNDYCIGLNHQNLGKILVFQAC